MNENEVKCDPIEHTKQFKAIEKELEDKILKKIGPPKGMGYCHLYWYIKKKILKEDYNIIWNSPADLNPHIYFD